MSEFQIITSAEPASLARFDAVIDVRSPGEFAEDHVPGAINLPVLSDAERAEVGTIYVQESRFKARRIGAAYVARNVAHHLETALADQAGAFMPLIYCWRGGQRSNAMATILSQVGWRTSVLAGGNAYPVIPVASAPTGTTLHLPMIVPTGGLAVTGGTVTALVAANPPATSTTDKSTTTPAITAR